MIGPQVSCTMAHPKDWACPICDKTNPAQDVSDQCLGSAFRELACSGPLNFLLGIETVIQRARELQQAQVVGEAELDAKAKAMFNAQKDPLAAPWERQWSETIKYWREKAATPQSSAQVVGDDKLRSLVDLWRTVEDNGEEHTEFDAGYEQASRECADALESALTGRG